MLTERWRFFLLVLGIWTSASYGAVLAFSLLIPTLRGERCQFSTHSITLVSSLSQTIFGLVSLPVGFLYDKFGPAVTIAISVFPQVLGWSLQAAAFHGSLPCTLFTVLLGNALATLTVETAVFLPMLATFAFEQGSVVALMKTLWANGGKNVPFFPFQKKIFFWNFFLLSNSFLFLFLGVLCITHPSSLALSSSPGSGWVSGRRLAWGWGCTVPTMNVVVFFRRLSFFLWD